MSTKVYSTATRTTSPLPPVFLMALVTRPTHAVYNVMLRTPDGLGRKVGTIRRDGTQWRVTSNGSNGMLHTSREAATDAALALHRRITAMRNHPATWQAHMTSQPCEVCGESYPH